MKTSPFIQPCKQRGTRLAELISDSVGIMNVLPSYSECYEENILKALLSGPKTFEDLEMLVSQRNVSRIIKRLKKVDLLNTPTERDYIFFFKSKRDACKEKFSSTEQKVYNAIPEQGIAAQKLAKKTALTMRATYKYTRSLKGKKLVFTRRMPKLYCLTVKGEELASTIDKLYNLVDETLISSEQVFRNNENIAPKVSDVSQVSPSKVPLSLCG